MEFLSKDLLTRPNKQALWPYELNRLQFGEIAPSYLDQVNTQNQEKVMILGMFIIAKFFILKHVMSSEVYDFGVEFDDL